MQLKAKISNRFHLAGNIDHYRLVSTNIDFGASLDVLVANRILIDIGYAPAPQNLKNLYLYVSLVS